MVLTLVSKKTPKISLLLIKIGILKKECHYMDIKALEKSGKVE